MPAINENETFSQKLNRLQSEYHKTRISTLREAKEAAKTSSEYKTIIQKLEGAAANGNTGLTIDCTSMDYDRFLSILDLLRDEGVSHLSPRSNPMNVTFNW